jgi:molecular chaperone Hsp33
MLLIGHMNVSKILYGATKAYETTVEASGSAQEDWQRYFDLSEQVPTVVRLSSKPENGIWLCCGFTIQQIAGYPGGNSHLYLDEVRYSNKSTMTEAILSGMDPITYLNREILPAKSAIDENTVKRIPIDYFCRCSKRSYAASLIALGSTELESIHKSGGDGFNLTCNFCNECHYFSSAELDELIELCNFQK